MFFLALLLWLSILAWQHCLLILVHSPISNLDIQALIDFFNVISDYRHRVLLHGVQTKRPSGLRHWIFETLYEYDKYLSVPVWSVQTLVAVNKIFSLQLCKTGRVVNVITGKSFLTNIRYDSVPVAFSLSRYSVFCPLSILNSSSPQSSQAQNLTTSYQLSCSKSNQYQQFFPESLKFTPQSWLQD